MYISVICCEICCETTLIHLSLLSYLVICCETTQSINLLTFWGVGILSLICIFLKENQSRGSRFIARHIENVCCQHRGRCMYKVQAVCYNYIFNQNLAGLSFVSSVIELSTSPNISTSTPNSWLYFFVSIKEACTWSGLRRI